MISQKYSWLKLILIYGLYAIWWWSCATVGTLSGGPEDTTPPQIDSLKSTPNYQVNFQEKSFYLTFDEWVVLKDVFNQVIISPPLRSGGKPKVSLRRKTVKVDLGEEDLRPDATYIVNFGEAIRDLTNDNAAENLRFVFSTGAYIDSLELSGTVVDALTGAPVEKALFMLYDNLSDTVVRKDIPFYFSKTDQRGNFRLQNIKADTFKTFALLSTDPNYRYDQPSEKIGFLDSFIVVTDSTRHNLRLRIFQELPPLKIKKKSPGKYGYYRIEYNQPPFDTRPEIDSVGQKYTQIVEGDSLKIWYHWQNDESWNMYFRQDTLIDTLVIDTTGRALFLANNKLKRSGKKPDGITRVNPVRGITLRFDAPLEKIDSSKVFLREDSLLTRVFPDWKIDSLDSRKLQIQYKWKAGGNYQLEVLPGALTSIHGLTTDTLRQSFQAQSRDDFGIFTINLTEMDSLQQYVFQLQKQDKTISERILSGQKNYQIRLEGLDLGKDYVVRLIEDKIPNGRWDTGSYDEKRQPERIRLIPLQELRANFEAEEKIKGQF